jgi:hypothetical protein
MKNGTGIGSLTSVRPSLKFHSGNTPLLTVIEELYSRKIYKKAADIYNTKGESATIEYMKQHINTISAAMGLN